MRVLFLSGYVHPAHHRKVELLADAPDADILHIAWPNSGRAPGRHPSASGLRAYQMVELPVRWLGHVGDVHRVIHWPPRFHLSSFRPDIVHCEQEQEGLMALQVALSQWLYARRAPLILYAWQNILRRRRWHVHLVGALTLRAARHTLCASQEAAIVLRRQGYRGDVSIMPMFGLDTRYFHPKPALAIRQTLKLQDFVVGYVGRLVPEKGVDVLLHAAAQSNASPQVMIVGDGPERGRLQSLAGELGLADRCRFVGKVEYDAMVDYLNALDVLVLPSRTTPKWKEQFGRVLVEAMACRVAVVGSDSGAIPEVIGNAGYIFREGQTAALAAIIDELTASPAQRHTLAKQGYQRALRHYTVEQLANDIQPIWRQLYQETLVAGKV